MSLSSSHLDAFIAIARKGSFSKAAIELSLTQSGVSQKLKKLETALGQTLIIRHPQELALTDAGKRLLNYVLIRDHLENELLHELGALESDLISGQYKIGVYSSIYQSAILPVLAPLLRDYPDLKIQFLCDQIQNLPNRLLSGELDFIIMDYQWGQKNIIHEKIGVEKYIAIVPKNFSPPNNTYIDNSPDDQATIRFLTFHGKDYHKIKRVYFHDCHAILEAVAYGLGRAVMPKHLVLNRHDIKADRKYSPMNFEVTLHYRRQEYYPRSHQLILKTLKNGIKKILR
jgi:DNA-binding transcriptional LysR family regulator